MSQADFLRHRERIRAWLLGKEYFKAVEALEFASKYHTGLRKNGEYEFQHQISICHYLRTLPNLRNQEVVLAVGFLHDTLEDKNISREVIKQKFGPEILEGVCLLSKVIEGKYKDEQTYFSEMGDSYVASIVKGGDRIHNHQSLVGAFSFEKQKTYIWETESLIMPMLKVARNNFPDQELAYENIKYTLKGQMEFIKLGIEYYEKGNKPDARI